MIAIIDYDAGNLRSVEKALAFLGEESVITRDFKVIEKADKVILPGVGSFGVAMDNLKKYELDKVIHMVCEKNTPFLGICLGLQLMFDGSEESEGMEGLGLLSGDIVKIPDATGLKVPHIGWNSLKLSNQGRLFKGLKAKNPQIVKATTQYGATIHASVEEHNIFACQFHPEKSSTVGLHILDNFAKLAGGDR